MLSVHHCVNTVSIVVVNLVVLVLQFHFPTGSYAEESKNNVPPCLRVITVSIQSTNGGVHVTRVLHSFCVCKYGMISSLCNVGFTKHVL